MEGYGHLLKLCRRYQNNEFDVIEFREWLQTVLLPHNPENETVERIYDATIRRLDEIEYCCTPQDADNIGKMFADDMIKAIEKQ